MSAKFIVVKTFVLESRNLFVLAGNIIEGQIDCGMILKIPGFANNPQVNSVEYVDFELGRSTLGLTFKNISKTQIEVLQKLKPNDILIIDSQSG